MRKALALAFSLGMGLGPELLLFAVPWAQAQEGGRDPGAEVIRAIRQAHGDVSWFSTPDGLMRRASLGFGPVSAESLRLLRQLDHLHSLTLHWPKPMLEAEALQALGKLNELRALEIDAHDFRDADLRPLANLTELRELTFRGAHVTDGGLASLAGLVKLQRLELPGSVRVTGAGLRHVEGLADLRELHLAGTRVEDAGLAHLARLRRLRSLRLEGTAVRGAGLAHLGGLPELDRLSLKQTRIDDAGLAHLPPAQRVRLVDVTGTAVTPAPSQNPAAGLSLKVEGPAARVVDAATGRAAGPTFEQTPRRNGPPITCWAISPDGRLVATGSSERRHEVSANVSLGVVQVWDARTGEPQARLDAGAIAWVAFRPDGKTVLFQAERRQVDGP